MDLVKITDLTPQLGLTSRSLRYYEELGLIQSVRLPGEKYRYFDEQNIERLKQIIVLRKMMIPIKDILRIFESDDMSVVVEVFVNRLSEIDHESIALSELRSITEDFLNTMQQNGVKKISALPLLYEAVLNQELEEDDVGLSYEGLEGISKQLSRPVNPAVIYLSPMRVLSSYQKDRPHISDSVGFWNYMQMLPPSKPGGHEQFEFQANGEDVVILRVADDFKNDSAYLDYRFLGGLFAAENVYLDEDLRQRFLGLVSYFDENLSYEIDYIHGGGMRHEAMLESLLSPDERRELVSLLVPVKKRLAAPDYFGQPEETAATIAEIEEANPVLWTKDAPLDRLIPINGPHYRVTDQGEAEYISWISTRVLSTGIPVKIPFRVDMEFRVGEESGGWGHGKNEGSIRFHHGEDLNRLFGINMENRPDERLSQEAVCFHQPLFGDYFSYPGRGGINEGQYNSLSWIVGLKHFAVIINGEVRYCGVNFPYMAADLTLQEALPIIIGSDSSIKKYYRSIKISQLAQNPKIKIEEGAFTMVTKQSNNIIPNIHRLITSEFGENYWFNGCARYLLEAAGEFREDPGFGYWFFAGLTGDILAQVYSYGKYMGESVSACRFNLEGGAYLEGIFEKCGYASSFVTAKQLAANREMYLQTLIAYIDKGMPVLAVTSGGPPWGVYVGYEEYGKILLYITGDQAEPQRVPIDSIIGPPLETEAEPHAAKGWLFLGEKKREIDYREVYRCIITDLPALFAVKNEYFCFGAEAFRAWAEKIESGYYETIPVDDFDDWGEHVSNICNMATNGSCADGLLQKIQELNPDLPCISALRELYKQVAVIWNGHFGGNLEPHSDDLEALGGGFNVTLESLQDRDKRGKIAAKIYEAANCMEQAIELVRRNMDAQ